MMAAARYAATRQPGLFAPTLSLSSRRVQSDFRCQIRAWLCCRHARRRFWLAGYWPPAIRCQRMPRRLRASAAARLDDAISPRPARPAFLRQLSAAAASFDYFLQQHARRFFESGGGASDRPHAA